MPLDLSELRVAIVSHTYAMGPPQALLEFLKDKTRIVVFISHPFYFSREIVSSAVEYRNGEEKRKIEGPKIHAPELLLYAKDFLMTFYFIFKLRHRYDLYVGADPLNALVGLFLRAFHVTKKVVFYTIDYNPRRFKNPFLNWIYHKLDQMCVRRCDMTWNLSPAMATEREKKGLDETFREKQITVPVGTDLNVKRHAFEEINRSEIAFVGHLREGQGIEFLIGAMPEMIKKIPQLKLVLIGTGPLEQKIREQVNSLNLQEHVEFTGFIVDHRTLQDRLAKCAIAVAPYVDDEKTFTRFTDPGKPKVYLASGLPVVITKVPQVASEIEKERCGFAIEYNKTELVDSVVRLLKDDEILKEYRKNAVKFAEKYEWNKIFEKNLQFINQPGKNTGKISSLSSGGV